MAYGYGRGVESPFYWRLDKCYCTACDEPYDCEDDAIACFYRHLVQDVRRVEEGERE